MGWTGLGERSFVVIIVGAIMLTVVMLWCVVDVPFPGLSA
jgi:hypothetical protein